MNIVHFSAGRINPEAAKVGSANVIYWLAREQARMGHAVSVVVTPSKTDYQNIKDAGFEILEYPASRLGGFLLPPQLRQGICARRIPIDIAHLHSFYSPEMVAISRVLAWERIPYVVSSHGCLSPLIRKNRRLLKWGFLRFAALPCLHGASFLHVHSEDEVRDGKDLGVRVPFVVAEQGFDFGAIPAATDCNWLTSKYPESKDAFKLLFLGRLDPWCKGLDLLLHGFAEALPSIGDVVLFMVGPEKRRYSGFVPATVSKLRLDGRVICTGPLYDPFDKYSALMSCDLFVLTSRFEGFPLVLWEAMACAKPVLVTPGTHAAGLVGQRNAGFVCECTPESIAEGILKAVAKRDQLGAMGHHAKEVVKEFTWRKTASKLLDAYASVLSGKIQWGK